MFSEVRGRAKKAGKPPGTAIYTGTKKHKPASVTVVIYNTEKAEESAGATMEEVLPLLHSSSLQAQSQVWVNMEGLHDISQIKTLASYFHLHPLTIEDILNVQQRPKVEEFENYIFITLKVMHWQNKSLTFGIEQLSLVIGKNFLLTFQETDTTRFDGLRERLVNANKQIMRQQGCDYLAYRVIDAVVDEYFVVLEAVGDMIEKIEDRIIDDPSPLNAKTIYRLKRQMLILRKSIWPMREAISHLLHVDYLISEFTRVYLRDVYDHSIQAIDTLETFRDMLSSMLDMYLSSMTNRMNEIMKTLTIITTIFIPITAIASIYGMNFTELPGLHSLVGLILVLCVMLSVAVLMIFYFFKRKWF